MCYQYDGIFPRICTLSYSKCHPNIASKCFKCHNGNCNIHPLMDQSRSNFTDRIIACFENDVHGHFKFTEFTTNEIVNLDSTHESLYDPVKNQPTNKNAQVPGYFNRKRQDLDQKWRTILASEKIHSSATVTLLNHVLENKNFYNTVFLADDELITEIFRLCSKIVQRDLVKRLSVKSVEINSVKFMSFESYTNMTMKSTQSYFPEVLNCCSDLITSLPDVEFWYSIDDDEVTRTKVQEFYNAINPDEWIFSEKIREHLITSSKSMTDYAALVQNMVHRIQSKIKQLHDSNITETSAFGNFCTFISFLHTMLVDHYLKSENVRIIQHSETGVPTGNPSNLQVFSMVQTVFGKSRH